MLCAPSDDQETDTNQKKKEKQKIKKELNIFQLHKKRGEIRKGRELVST